MKILLGILALLFSSVLVCHSQPASNDTVRLTKLPPEGILLDKGWKFHSGDDSAWAKPDFNDKGWQPINPTLDIRHIAQLQNVSIFWLRLTLLVDSSLMDQPLGMTLLQVGASEIYLNGTLIYKFGIVDKKIEREQTNYLINRPYSLKLGSAKLQTIAVKYSYNPKAFLIKWGFENSCLHIVLNTVGFAFSTFQKNARFSLIFEMSQASLWLLLSIISFGLYFSIRGKKEYLLIGLYSISICCSNILGGLIARELSDTTISCYIYFFSRILLMTGLMIALSALYRLFYQNKNWYYYTLMLGGFLGMGSFLIFYDQAMYIYLIIFILYGIEFIHSSWIAVRHKRPGALMILLSAFSFFLLVALFIILVNFNYILAATFCGFLAGIILPFTWSLFIAGEFGRTALTLKERVKDIELLSQQAVSQEREKQQILARQNETLELKVSERTSQLSESLISLRATQAQLIQSEKMASLGELTAGIAHEIQNPLNFVNNFSDLNKELIDEASKANEEGNSNGVKELLSTLKNNEEKIFHHGKRADAIVKGMLQHSRASTGQKESVYLNRLVDEYLRISYQGMRTRESSFNSKIETHFDQDIGKIEIIPQEIGRVLLNLYNNAFYAVTEKKKQHPEGFDPVVTVSTVKKNDVVEVRVKDNGNGIPKKILDKIFQPFFTTKPTGQGTGLGLSLSYDIIKAHGGEIKVDTEEGKFTEFTIALHI